MSANDPDVDDTIEYINATAAACSQVDQYPVADAYRYLVRFFGSALLDRTQTLQPGFPYRVLDLIPTANDSGSELAELCNQRGHDLLAEATAAQRPLHMLWSGGIDSTTALVALLKAAEQTGQAELIQVFYSGASVREFRSFFKQIIQTKLIHHKIKKIQQALDPNALIVTGEHGDQIFGSVLAGQYLREKSLLRNEDKRLFEPWQQVFPAILAETLKDQSKAELAYDFLLPQLQHVPIALNNLFDLLWWVNFSMKWQAVTLRIPASVPGHYASLRQAMRHFFRTEAFQHWSLLHHQEKIGEDWVSYKMPLKRYIHDFFPDDEYLATKLKQPSLGRINKAKPTRVWDFDFGVQLHTEAGRGDSCTDGNGE